MSVPAGFLARMRDFPGLDYAAFRAALEQEPVRGLRVNTVKTTAARLTPLLPFAVTPVPFLDHAFYAAGDKVGGLPAHHAGMFYMQDPSAMSAVAALPSVAGLRAIDLCAAPGGKTAQLAAALGEGGVLVSNEYVPARCRVLQGNVERMGLTNVAVTNLDVAALAGFYGAYFDLVVADAPCSGEGMFRKYEAAGAEWSPENVALCAARQRDILENAAKLVRAGGKLLYATCTFSLEENEQNAAWFLDTHPDFRLIPVSPRVEAVTAGGVCDAAHPGLSLTRRFYPHLSLGEGQYIALFERADAPAASAPRDATAPVDKAYFSPVTALMDDTLAARPRGNLRMLRGDVWLCPDVPLPPRGVFAAGVCVGTPQKGRLEPHHQFFSAYGAKFCRQLDLKEGDARVAAYLRGEEIDAPDLSDGFAAVLYEGAPLGGGKVSGGRLKNRYPKGLRNRA